MPTAQSQELVFISNRLPKRCPTIAADLRKFLGDRLRIIPGTKDIWCRDFMPIPLGRNRFVQFRYEPNYLRNDPELHTADAAALLDLTKNALRSDLIVDGGNVIRHGHAAIMTDKVFTENRPLTRAQIKEQLRQELELEQILFIPRDLADALGHADGVVRFVDDHTLLVSDYRRLDRIYANRLQTILKGFDIVWFPFRPSEWDAAGQPKIEPATGVYINFLQTENFIFCPAFGLREDDEAATLLRQCFPGRSIVPLRAESLAKAGGVLHCATWNATLPDQSRTK